MKAVIKPCKLSGEAAAPPSKSYAHRMLIGAALSCLSSEEESRVAGISSSEDMLATMDCLKALGFHLEKEEETVRICRKKEGLPAAEPAGPELPVFPCRESGSTLRFFIPLALALCGGGIFTGAKRLIERGIGIYQELFEGRGISVKTGPETIEIRGRLEAGSFSIRGNVSSQFITGMLFALPLLDGESRVRIIPPVESRPYIDITLDVLAQFGISAQETEEDFFTVPGGQKYRSGEYEVEGDWSNAAFLFAFNALGNDLRIRGLKNESRQGDKACVRFLETLKESGPEGGKVIDLSDTPDLGPVLFAAAAALNGGSFTGIERLRIKESDRAEAMETELSRFGAECQSTQSSAMIEKRELKKPAVPLNGHNDHRIVMALSVLACVTGGEIEGAEAVKKSWPGFFQEMEKLGMKVTLE